MIRILRCAAAAILVAAASLAPLRADAFSFNRTITLHPMLFQTFVSGVTHFDSWTCGIFACLSTNGLIPDAAADVLLKKVSSRIAIGYDFFEDPGTNPCPCGSFGLAQFRGSVFLADDIAFAKPIVADGAAAGFKHSEYPALAKGKLRFVGEMIALCVAPSRAEAEDIAQALTLDIEELPAVWDR